MKKIQDVFAWSHKDMLGIYPSVIGHDLNVDKNYPLVQQRDDYLTKTGLKH